MKIMLPIQHPAWVHQFRPLIEKFRARGDQVYVMVCKKDGNTDLLDAMGIPYILLSHTTGKGVLQKGWLFFWLTLKDIWYALRYRPDVVMGRASPMLCIAAWVRGRRMIVFEDTEVSKFSLRVCKLFAQRIITSESFLWDLGPKQERVHTYKEMFYLHPSVFTPDRDVPARYGLNPDQPYTVVRFVAWNASHDVGLHGLDDAGKIRCVKALEQYGPVYVTSEAPLPAELESYRLPTPYEAIHHVLAFAALIFSEGATVASEAAVLGTHAVYINPIVLGYVKELEEKYDLLYAFPTGADRYERALVKAQELLADPELRAKGKRKQAAVLEGVMDINQYLIKLADEEYAAHQPRAGA